MRLLFITQKVDMQDQVLGFVHGWLRAFAKQFLLVRVVCLQEGAYQLPSNTTVYSLGKERGVSRFTYIKNFYQYIFRERNTYDVVFVHMNPEYVLLAGIMWRILGKKVVLWYNHPDRSLRARIAFALAHQVLCTSPYAYAAQFPKTKRMPVGVDTDVFLPQSLPAHTSFLYVGRISPVKHIEVLIDAAKKLAEEQVRFHIDFFGSPTNADAAYARTVYQSAAPLVAHGYTTFHDGVAHTELPEIIAQHAVLINMTPTGSFDKVLPEAMACERLVLTSNRSLENVLPAPCMFAEDDATDLATKMKTLLEMPVAERERLGKEFRHYVCANESLEKLVRDLHDLFRHLL